jgi:hypothetical protein
MNNIVIIDNEYIYIIEKEPYESDENTYNRGWYIINNHNKIKNLNELISRSIIVLNENKNNMKFS